MMHSYCTSAPAYCEQIVCDIHPQTADAWRYARSMFFL